MRLFLIGLGLCYTLAACAQAPAPQPQSLTVTVPTPNPCWRVVIDALYRTPDALLVVARMTPPEPGLACIQMLGQASDTIKADLPQPVPPARYLVVGHPWPQAPEDLPQSYTFVKDEAALQQRLSGAAPVDFQRQD